MASETAPQIPTAKGIMTFHPTMDEFQDFTRYIAYMESQGAHKAGLAKIIPPKEWKPRSNYDDIDELVIPAPIQQVVSGQSGLFIQYNIQKKAMTVSEFRKLANSEKFCCPRHENFEELERKYWKNVTFNPPIYGADVNGTLYDPKVKDWNVGKLHTILDTVEHESGITIEGVNTPYLYFGMWKTTFAWHTEDMDLYSINYLHFGEPKSWYCVPPEHGKRMERLAHGFFPSSAQNCEAFLRHKMTLISPSILRKYGIPFERMTQHAGEFMVTFPYSYHAGFNHGFNCAESTNFATERWIEYGKLATLCSCRKDMVKISMDVFVKKYQPERYEQWLAGRDMGHIDHSRPTSEAKEFPGEEPGDTSSSSQEICVDDCSTDGERKSPTQRIGTKRHRVCLEVPEEVVPKEEEEEEEEFIKRPRLSLLPPRAATEESRKLKGPPKLVVTPTKLTLMELPCLRMSSSSIPPASFRAQAQPLPRNGHLKVGSLPTRPGVGATSAQPARKLGVASLLFHKTLSPKETLQVHGNAHSQQQEQQQQQHHLQLHVHSYAREHQPRQLQHMGRPQDQARAPSQAGTETQDVKIIFTKVEKNQAKAASGEEVKGQSGKNDPRPAGKAQAPLERSAVKVVPVQAATHAKGVKKEVPQVNKRKGSGEQSYCKTVKDKQRAQLHNLPRQHPLLRADNTSSDEDTEVEVGEEYIPEDSNSWAKPLAQLWQNRPFNPQAEADFNRRMGLQAPYCSICLLFYTHHQSESSPDTLVGRHGEKQRSKPLIPEMCFNTVSKAANESGEGHLSTPHLERDGTSRLLSCTQCCVRVHASCYGVSADEAELDWLCARCEANAKTEDCCLCSLRGGALHRANNDKWVHVLCAITVLEARFVDIAERSPIDLRGIPLPRFRLKCQFCRKRMRQEVNGCCVQCSHGRCSTSFHPTCAQAAGVLMYPDDWPFVVFITCHRHKAMGLLEKRIKIGMAELTVGQKVISKFKNGRYYHSEVVELTSATFYEVIFDDGSYSDNLFPEDIENRDCVRLGPPSEGDMVQVRWTDGLIYGAKFVKSQSIPMYQVEFEDGSQISVKREEIYSLDEDLPKRVKSRMSVASDQKFGIFTEKDVKKNSKRQRVINSRYREDYVEPIIYRAILD